ncbi:hypothetical protein PCE1_000695 [Barthelona sp. PCE]
MDIEDFSDSKVGCSACLLGAKCRYDGDSKENLDLIEFFENTNIEPIFICPEVLGGLPTPRIPSEICDGTASQFWEDNSDVRVMNSQNIDVSRQFRAGALRALEILKENQIGTVILMEKSPSCGVHLTYSGNFNGKLIPGSGVSTALFKKNEINVLTSEEFLCKS